MSSAQHPADEVPAVAVPDGVPAASDDAPGAGKPRTMRFRRSDTPRLDSEHAGRQGLIVRRAFELLGGRDAAMAFLNTEDTALGGRPLDIAMASEAGFQSIEDAMRLRSQGAAA